MRRFMKTMAVVAVMTAAFSMTVLAEESPVAKPSTGTEQTTSPQTSASGMTVVALSGLSAATVACGLAKKDN